MKNKEQNNICTKLHFIQTLEGSMNKVNSNSITYKLYNLRFGKVYLGNLQL